MPALPRLSTLQWALAASVAFHAGVLSIRFVDSANLERMFRTQSLDVVLVNTRSDEAPRTPQALAQHNLAGGGTSGKIRVASSPLPPVHTETPGDALLDENQRQIENKQRQQELLLAQVREKLATMPRPTPRQIAQNPEARAQEERRKRLMELLGAIEKRIEEENLRPRKRYLSPSTLGSIYALYYDNLRRRIEAEGTRRFPRVGTHKLYGELVMVLLVHRDGSILDARVLRSSGDHTLDRMAEAIAQKASPFGPFTPEMLADTDQFEVAALFRFTRDNRLQTSLQDSGSDLVDAAESRTASQEAEAASLLQSP